jgi:ATP-dependent RNA helicase DHX37/DHR1
MPAGAILVFVTGQQDIRTLLRWLRKAYPRVLDNATTSSGKVPPPDLDQPSNDDSVDEEESTSTTINTSPLYCLPLYSLLAPDQQARVFAPSPSDCRLCIIATNVAETSITIPGVRYVIDCGKEKSREYDPITGVTRFSVRWICKASAAQRAGRAGRTAPGHAYRLYSSALFNDEMVEFGAPEILAKPVDQLVLQLKSMNIVRVRNFPFPTAPDADAIDAAERRLVRMGALELSTKKEARITTLGRTLALFPLAPAFGKILAISDQHSLLPYAVCLVAALSVREPIYALTDVRGDTDDSVRQKMMVLMQQRREWSNTGYQSRQLGDLCVLIKAVCAVEKDGGGANVCDRYGVHYKAMIEVRKLRRQLTNIINRTCTQLSQPLVLDAHMQPMSALQEKLLRYVDGFDIVDTD